LVFRARARARTDVVAVVASAESRADLLVHEVTGYRASNKNALEAQHIEEVSHAACCHRSWRPGIADLHSCIGRSNSRGEAIPDALAREADGPVAAKPGDRGDLVGGVSSRGCSEGCGPRGSCGPGNAGEDAGRWSSRHQDRPAG